MKTKLDHSFKRLLLMLQKISRYKTCVFREICQRDIYFERTLIFCVVRGASANAATSRTLKNDDKKHIEKKQRKKRTILHVNV